MYFEKQAYVIKELHNKNKQYFTVFVTDVVHGGVF